MKIGIIGSIWIRIPPQDHGFGAQEYLVHQLAEGLIKKGHDVTLFTTGDAETNAKIVSASPAQVIDLKPADLNIKSTFELINVSQAYKMAHDFDIIHNHLLPYGLLFADNFKTPTVHTLHHEIYHISDKYLYRRFKDQNYISISNSQRKVMHELNYISTVYNGVDTDFYNFQEKPSDNYLLYIGRLKRYKGVHTAIDIAKTLGLNLKIATAGLNPSQPDYEEVKEYWENDIKPHLNSQITHVGEVKGQEKVSLLQNAKAMILPIEREEPFGMTVIESMACGTPVIAYANGAMPELIHDGETGFLVDGNLGLAGLCEAVKQLNNLTGNEYTYMRKKSRESVVNNFTEQKMVAAYEEIYKNFLL